METSAPAHASFVQPVPGLLFGAAGEAIMPTTKDASGYKRPNGEKQIAVRMPGEIFDQVQRKAVEANTSICAQMLNYIEQGVRSEDRGKKR
jgi:hypothetical protein